MIQIITFFLKYIISVIIATQLLSRGGNGGNWLTDSKEPIV